jgi:lysine-N-methylase
MSIENHRCPMWRRDGLCEIQAQLGHDALCQTCRDFPRLRHDYGDYVELGLELSCPEAARLLFAPYEFVEEVSPGGEPECDARLFGLLLESRKEALTFLETSPLPLGEKLAVLLLYAYDVQEELDGGESAILNPDSYLQDVAKLPLQGDVASLQVFFQDLEILTAQWESQLRNIGSTPVWDGRFKALLRYFIGRYWLQAVSDYDIVCRAKFTVAACVLIGYLGGDLTGTAQLFSKEIENDPDNVEAILDGAYTARGLTDLNLLGLLA